MNRIALTLALFLLVAGSAFGAPPPNDARTSAQGLGELPAAISGTTVDSTLAANLPDEVTSCGNLKGNVWFELAPGPARRVVSRLTANGDLDGVLAIYRRERSQIISVGCDATDKKGEALVGFDAEKDTTYLIQVGQLANSVAGTFALQVFVPQPPASAPGVALPSGGVRQTVDALRNPSDAWSAELQSGVSYRVNLTADNGDCVTSLSIYGPNVTSLSDVPSRSLECGGYHFFTPGPDAGGRYSFVVEALSDTKGPRAYRLQLAPARADDTAPGIALPNDRSVTETLNGSGIDVLDLYRFDVVSRSDLSVELTSKAVLTLDLVNDNGGEIASTKSGFPLRSQLRPGRYFLAINAPRGQAGTYRLRRLARAITSTRLSIGSTLTVTPGATIPISVAVTPHATGQVSVIIERFDPLAGWQFARTERLTLVAGQTKLAVVAPTVGRWRASATFIATRAASGSTSRPTSWLVAGPLKP